jgi:hypothetical protein
MNSYRILVFSCTILFAFSTIRCTDHNISDIRIERFEKLDEQPRLECYLVYGYHKSIEQEVGSLIDRYVCDSIFPNIVFDTTGSTQKKVLYFFKKTQNTNNKEKYRSKIKKAIAHRDIIFEYVFDIKEYSKVVPTRKKYRVNDPDMVSEPFRCN